MPEIFALFRTGDEPLKITPFGTGNINHTFLVEGLQARYVLQKINTLVFPDPELMMHNIDLITSHIAKKQPKGRNLRVIKTKDGKTGYRDGNDYWRLYNYLENTRALDVITSPGDAYAAAAGFGGFLNLLSDLDPRLIRPVLPEFHNVPFRIHQLDEAINENRAGRREEVRVEIEQIKTFEPAVLQIFQRINSGEVPVRITHNDTKISNVLLDEQTLNPVAVVDLDTVMAGSVLFDLGDMIRTFLSPVDENEADVSKVAIRPEMLAALVGGYHQATKGILTETEKEMVIDAGKMLVFTQTIRFLTDYLNGDVYYKTLYPGHNLVRTRNQLRLLSLLAEGEAEWKAIVNRAFSLH